MTKEEIKKTADRFMEAAKFNLASVPPGGMIPILILLPEEGESAFFPVLFRDERDKEAFARTVPELVKKVGAQVAFFISEEWRKSPEDRETIIGETITVSAVSRNYRISKSQAFTREEGNHPVWGELIETEIFVCRFLDGAFTDCDTRH